MIPMFRRLVPRRFSPDLAALAAVLLVVAGVAPAGAASPGAAPGAPPAAAAPPSGTAPPADPVDPAALAALDRMAAHLAGLRAFEVEATYAFDIVARTGQTVTVDGTVRYLVRRPDRLAATVANDLFARTYLYDGKTLTIASPAEPYYAQVPARPTLRDMLAGVAAEHAIELPSADLVDLGTAEPPSKGITGAFRVGTATVGGVAAEHYAFRSRDRDWEVWIAAGDTPRPLKLTLIDRAQPSRPRYTATLAWTERTDIPDQAFVFTPRPDQTPIAILRLGRTQGSN
ncbi:DUF2092 domain-containing protein [Rhodoplanes sp. TEM]|uniref:DUF2092 domain-containing protein n=2 Tax=Rhodoplanes TaxID=29407 RepID=A0ABT5JAE0_RHOTP|nr:DUF2092 domain-containing protein [Rhodoplanes tepidamans]MDC7786020.1 DUF2092 domain-containing protein [Rhodoplanes tepidamans]MDC7983839.1 DUF2092 domain-containing protein [Rhodoplanes sp. TEM]MDQ0354862.1 hypothetical protein [Rhodoplanes tepidamans]